MFGMTLLSLYSLTITVSPSQHCQMPPQGHRLSFELVSKQERILCICLQLSYEILTISGVRRHITVLWASTQHSQLAGKFSLGYCNLVILVASVVSPLYVILHLVMNEASNQLLNILRTRPWATVHFWKKKKIVSDSKPRASAAPGLSYGFRFWRRDCSSRLFRNTCTMFTGAVQWFVHCFKSNSLYKLHFILSWDTLKFLITAKIARNQLNGVYPIGDDSYLTFAIRWC